MENVYSNYFSSHYAGKFYSIDDAKAIGEIREYIKGLYNGKQITERENYILIASLLYSMDKSANTVGHYESYRKNISLENKFQYKLIEPSMYKAMSIYEKDANGLVKEIESDIVYIDPPYNSRQYSRFYHLLENVATWNKPEVFGTALKPPPTNLSEYCRVGAKQAFSELVKNIKAKYIAVSYNNTYNSKSSSSANKMTLEQIREILESKGRTDVHEKPYKHFNAGNTNFNNHKELLFVTEVRNG
jgi:adenine-specific DNA-methyltransferase